MGINFYNIYSRNIFLEKYSIYKAVYSTIIFTKILKKDIDFEFQIAFIADILKECEEYEDEDYAWGYDNVDKYFDFINSNDLNDFNECPPNEFFGCGYPLEINQEEVNFYVKDFANQKNYIKATAYDAKTGIELPNYYFFLYCANALEDGLRGFSIPDNRNDIAPIIYEHCIDRAIKSYKMSHQKTLSRSNVIGYTHLFESFGKIIFAYIKNQEIEIKHLNYLVNDVNELRDERIKNFMLLSIKSFSAELESKELFYQCQNCLSFFPYIKTKLYCSEKCKIKAKNQRYCKNKKLKNIV